MAQVLPGTSELRCPGFFVVAAGKEIGVTSNTEKGDIRQLMLYMYQCTICINHI